MCGILVSRQNLNALNKAFENLKEDIFGTKDVVIHSVDISKWRGPFSILADESVRVRFFEDIESILSQHEVYVIVSWVQAEINLPDLKHNPLLKH